MQPSELEIQREVETLRDIKRRSSAPGSLIDPDLPTVSSESSSSSGYWDDSSSSSHSNESDNSSVAGDDPLNLFWVPARLHPEIAPAEFRQFLKEHARNEVDGASLSRASSVGSMGGLGRKKSMLSRQYNPSEKDGVEDEDVVPLRRNRTSVFGNQGPQLTINDLQKLEELAEEASQSSDPSRLRSVLRRSMSMNISPSVIDQMDNIPEQGDEADAPIIVPRPGQILRRAARTKIRKPGTGEGPHRFTSTRARRGATPRSTTLPNRLSDELSSSDHGDEAPARNRADSDVSESPLNLRPESYSEESSIYEAYAREDSDESETHAPLLVTSPETPEFQPVSPPEPQLPELSLPVLHHPKPQRVLSPPLSDVQADLRSPSPEIASVPHVPPVPPLPPTIERPQSQRPPLTHQSSSYQAPPSPSTSPSPSDHRRERDKKGLFGKWGGDKAVKRGHGSQREKEKEKDSGFFGSLFGKKKQDEVSSPPPGGLGNAGRETAAALLGSSKSAKSYVPPPSPQPMQGYARYPIHVERAIYRLSHIKLANPRRPLYEQVLISNLMFWYLGVINKSPTPATSTPASANGDHVEGENDREQVEREKREKEERERMERERLEKDREREREREKERERSVESKRKGSLTKSPTPGTAGARRAETPVRGPQYEMQHRAMEQEYVYQGGGPSMPRTSSSAPPPMGFPQQVQRGPPPVQYPSVQLVQPQPQVAQNRYYNAANGPLMGQPYGMNTQPGSLHLPPGAMSPAAVEQAWINSAAPPSASPPPRVVSPPSASARTSPPATQRYSPQLEKMQPVQGRIPGRSLSASAKPAVPSHRQVNGATLSRKGNSATAVMPGYRATEEEDVPLAVYQQRRK
ncbi:hypothetical protein BDW22DRAFT_1431750 [Trametopsis cervina]|nr:hypothetical protein BDW22DRAFT_1431750 [Trametopsis cervina]